MRGRGQGAVNVEDVRSRDRRRERADRNAGSCARLKGEPHGRHHFRRRWRDQFRAARTLRVRLWEGVMSFDYLVGAIGGVFVLIYLIVALLRSERF